MWWLPQVKRLLISESYGDSNWYTPCRGNLIHMIRTPLVRFLWAIPHMWQPFTLIQQSWTDPTTLEKKCSRLHPQHAGWPIRGTHPCFSPKNNYWSSRLKPNIYWRICYIGLLGSYHQDVISTFNTWSQGPTHQSLTNTNEHYKLGGADFPHNTSRLS
jgi:hypothetical protein